jgi:phage terminase small subunit
MPVLPNARHETFAQALSKGMNATEAYATAGYKGDRTAASRLSTNVKVAPRVAELQGRQRKAEVTVENTRSLEATFS